MFMSWTLGLWLVDVFDSVLVFGGQNDFSLVHRFARQFPDKQMRIAITTDWPPVVEVIRKLSIAADHKIGL